MSTSIKQLAAQIKADYPAYGDVDDHELISRLLNKHPEYIPTLRPDVKTALGLSGVPQEPQGQSQDKSGIIMGHGATGGRGYEFTPRDSRYPDETAEQTKRRMEMEDTWRQGSTPEDYRDPTAAQFPVNALGTPVNSGYGVGYNKSPLDPGYSPPQSIVDDLVRLYPSLKPYGIRLHSSVGAPTDWKGNPVAGRKLEFYAPNEPDNPRPGKPTIEQFDPAMTYWDALGEMFSHYLPSVNPQFKLARDQFISGIDAKQRVMLKGDYDNEIESGVYGTAPPSFMQWLHGQGGDAFFRGYIANQFPKELYRPDQVKLFQRLLKSLTVK